MSRGNLEFFVGMEAGKAMRVAAIKDEAQALHEENIANVPGYLSEEAVIANAKACLRPGSSVEEAIAHLNFHISDNYKAVDKLASFNFGAGTLVGSYTANALIDKVLNDKQYYFPKLVAAGSLNAESVDAYLSSTAAAEYK